MTLLNRLILAALVFLSGSSGFAKLLLVQQDVDFFGKYGINTSGVLFFGAAQLAGAVMLVFPKTRLSGVALVAITFLISVALLVLDGNVPFAVFTAIALLLLLYLARASLDHRKKHPG